MSILTFQKRSLRDRASELLEKFGRFNHYAKDESPKAAPELIYAIGDIHGRLDLLASLLEKIRQDVSASKTSNGSKLKIYIVFLGDYIDRGFESFAVVEGLSQLQFKGTELIFLKGNHEQVVLDFIDGKALGRKWLKYGGRETLQSYGIELGASNPSDEDMVGIRNELLSVLPARHIEFFKSLKSYWIKNNFMFVHAGVDPNSPVLEQSDKEYLWIRDKFLNNKIKLPYVIVHGHTPEDEPVWNGRRVGVDTGAYISNKLTAAKIHGDEVTFIST